MDYFKIYSISDRYIDYLRDSFPNVYSNKIDKRIHTRKYIGIVLTIDNICYYVPMSSPKKTDFQVAGNKMVIKKSIVPIMRIVIKNTKGEKELKGTLRLSHMIPVPESELTIFDLGEEVDEAYKKMIIDEMIFIRKNKDKIKTNAQLIYKQKKDDDNIGYVRSTLDFATLEIMCKEYIHMVDRRVECDVEADE